MVNNLLLVGLGGGAGSILRYLCQRWINATYMHSFPLATFLVNATGCLLIGMLYALAERSQVFTPQVRLLLVTGFCGGFTTFSTFAFENMSLIKSGDLFYFFLYAIGSIVVGLLAVYLGNFIIKLI